LHNVRDLVEMEDRLRACPGLEAVSDDLLWDAKQYGFSVRQLAQLWHTGEMEVRRVRKARGIEPVYKLVDTCAAEFEAYTPYYYSSDELFFEPLTAEDVLNICDRIQPTGLIVQFGGQTPLNLARALQNAGAPIIGTSVDSIDMAEDREEFKRLIDRLQLKQPPNGTALDVQHALHVARIIGFPVLVRPSFVLGGRAMEICYDEVSLKRYVGKAMEVSPGKPI